MNGRRNKVTVTGGRDATQRHIPGDAVLSVCRPSTLAVPKGWQWHHLGEIAKMESGHTPSRKHPEYWGGDIPWIAVGDAGKNHGGVILDTVEHTNQLGIDNSSARLLPKGTVCLSRGGTVGYVTVLGRPMATSQGFANWICGDKIDPFFLKYIFLREADALDRFAIGATIQTIYYPDIKAFHVCVPSLAEQQRIVGVLDEAFAGLATAQAHAAQNLQNARALFESHLQSVFTHRGKGWVETTLGDVGKVSMCKRIFKEETAATGDIPFYKIGTFGKEADAFIPIQTYNEYRAKYSFPKKGDVLISASGTIGRRVRYDGEPAYFQDSNIVWIDNDEKQVLNDYLFHFYGACKWNSTKGATISRLYNDNVRQIAIAFPDSHQEQKRIVTQLDALAAETQRLTRLYEQKQAALAALKKSLLHQAFTGEL